VKSTKWQLRSLQSLSLSQRKDEEANEKLVRQQHHRFAHASKVARRGGFQIFDARR
jgi:hypothetical protein